MIKTRTTLICLAAAALVLPAGADAAKTPLFKATVKGSQVSTWSQSHSPQFKCDATVNGNGSQMVRFESDPVKLELYKVKGSLPVLASADDAGAPYGAAQPIPAIAMADREGAQDIQAPGGECNGTGGWNGERPAADCGRRFGRLDLRIGYGVPFGTPIQNANLKDVLNVTGRYDSFGTTQDSIDPATFVGDALGNTFENCPYWADGPASPAIDELLAAGVKYPVKKLTSMKRGKSVTISADERMTSAAGDFSGDTLTTWNLKLKRVK